MFIPKAVLEVGGLSLGPAGHPRGLGLFSPPSGGRKNRPDFIMGSKVPPPEPQERNARMEERARSIEEAIKRGDSLEAVRMATVKVARMLDRLPDSPARAREAAALYKCMTDGMERASKLNRADVYKRYTLEA